MSVLISRSAAWLSPAVILKQAVVCDTSLWIVPCVRSTSKCDRIFSKLLCS
ncbi:hypothetical protein QUB50_04190 [Microcoleus sp. A6-C5]